MTLEHVHIPRCCFRACCDCEEEHATCACTHPRRKARGSSGTKTCKVHPRATSATRAVGEKKEGRPRDWLAGGCTSTNPSPGRMAKLLAPCTVPPNSAAPRFFGATCPAAACHTTAGGARGASCVSGLRDRSSCRVPAAASAPATRARRGDDVILPRPPDSTPIRHPSRPTRSGVSGPAQPTGRRMADRRVAPSHRPAGARARGAKTWGVLGTGGRGATTKMHSEIRLRWMTGGTG